jgi:hypothetical protein
MLAIKNVGRKLTLQVTLSCYFYAYYSGHTSSHVIERLCKTDFKFISLAASR